MAPRILVLPNVVRNAVAPNTLSGLIAAPSAAPRTGPTVPASGRRRSRLALVAGLGLGFVLLVLAGRSW